MRPWIFCNDPDIRIQEKYILAAKSLHLPSRAHACFANDLSSLLFPLVEGQRGISNGHHAKIGPANQVVGPIHRGVRDRDGRKRGSFQLLINCILSNTRVVA